MGNITYVLVLSISLFGCSQIYETNETITLYPNLTTQKEYKINIEFDKDQSANSVILSVQKNYQDIEYLKLFNEPVILNIIVRQDHIPFGLFNSHIYRGMISLTPAFDQGPLIDLPFTVYLKSWINTNSWIFVILLSLLSLVFFVNLVMYIVNPAARGTVEFLKPALVSYPIYPRSRIVHYKRNYFSIGSGKNDDYFVKKCPNLSPSHLVFKYKRQTGKLELNIISRRSFFYKNSNDVNYEQDPKVEYENRIPDYFLSENRLSFKGYIESNKFNLNSGMSYIIVLTDSCIVKITI